jgi:drug/metabolite transporter (DMT)-like permease
MILSAFFFALTDVVIKFISPAVAVTEIAFFRFSIGVAVLLPLMVPRGMSLKGDRTWILLIRGGCGTLTFFFLLKAIERIPLANAIVLFYTFPVFATVFSFLLFRESVGIKEAILIIAGMVGIYVLIDPAAHLYGLGDAFGLLAGCFAGISVVLIRKLRETNGPLIIYLYYCLVGSIVSFPFFLEDFRLPSFGQLLLLIVLGLAFLVAQVLMTQGFKFCKASEGSVILMVELVFVGLATVLIFKDVLSRGFLVGALLIVGSGVGLNLMGQRFRRSSVSQTA